MSTNPVQPTLKQGLYGDETGVFTDMNSISKFFATKKLRYSRTSPPILADVPEGEFILSKSELRIYIRVDGVLRYFQLT